MARLWTSGFELQSTATGMEWDTTTGTVSISTSTKRSGAAALRCNPTAGTGYISHQVRGFATARIMVRFYVNFATLPSADTAIFQWGDGSGWYPQVFYRQSTGGLQAKDASAYIGSSSAALTTNTWYKVTFDYDDFNAGNPLYCYLDDVAFCSGTSGSDLGSGGHFRMGVMNTCTADVFFDDVAFNDDSGTVQNAIPGAGKVVYLRPNAAGDSNQWLRGGGLNSGNSTNYTHVDDSPTPDDLLNDSVGLLQAGTTQVDEYNVTDCATAGIGSSDTITLVQIGLRAQGGAAGPPNFVSRVKGQSGGTVVEGSTVTFSSSAWNTNCTAFPHSPKQTVYVNPQTSTAWTPSTIDTMQIGLRPTVSTTTQRIVCAMWAVVEYVPAAGGGTTLSDSPTGNLVASNSSVAGVLRPGTGTSNIALSSSADPVLSRITTGTGAMAFTSSADAAVTRPGTGTSNIALSSTTAQGVLRPGNGTSNIALSSVAASGVLRPGTGTSNIVVSGLGDISGAQVGSGTATGAVSSNTQAGVIRPGTGSSSVAFTSNGSGSVIRVGSGTSSVTATGTAAASRLVPGTGSSTFAVSGTGDVSGTQTSTGSGSVAATSSAAPVVLRPDTSTVALVVSGTAVGNVVPALVVSGDGTSVSAMTGTATAVRITSAATSSLSTVTGTGDAFRELTVEGTSESTVSSTTDQHQIFVDESSSVSTFNTDETAVSAVYVSTGSSISAFTGSTAARVVKQIMLQYPDVEAKMALALSTFVPAGRVGTELPVDLAQKLPFIRVSRRGGGDDGVTDRARVDIEVFAATRSIGYPLIEKVRQYLVQTSPFRNNDDPFDFVTCDVGPQELPWGDGRTVRRWSTSYSVRSRRAKY